VTQEEPLAKVACPGCGEKFRVERTFDNFALLETLGVGGMGSVYNARDRRLNRFVALKILRPELSADPGEILRLEHEARATAAVNDPHVVQVFSPGTDHGQFYLVMEQLGQRLQTARRKFLADYRTYKDWKKQAQSFTGREQITAALTALRTAQGKLQLRRRLNEAFKDEETKLVRQLDERKWRGARQSVADAGSYRRFTETPYNHCHLMAPADLHPRIVAQLAGHVGVPVPLHLPLVDGQDVPGPGIRNDVALSDFLFEMRSGDRDVFVVRVVRLSF
jgi:hypothetical protein